MAGSIKECDILAVAVYSVRTDVLCDAARFGSGNVCVSDLIQKRSFTVVNVTHNNNYGRSLNTLAVVLGIVDKTLLDSKDNFLFYLCAQLLGNQ